MFVYSIRRGTPAARWEQVPKDVAAERFARLVAAQNASTRAYHDRKIGTTVRALVVGPSKKDATKLAAKTLDNVTVTPPVGAGTPRLSAMPLLVPGATTTPEPSVIRLLVVAVMGRDAVV